MPKAETTRIISRSPPDPHRIALPNTPAAVSRSNPIDPATTSNSSNRLATSQKDRDGQTPPTSPPAGRRAASEGPSSRPHPGVSRSTSTGSAGVVGRPNVPAAIAEKVEPEAEEVEESPIDMSTFGQILELDDGDPDHPFSKDIVEQYFEQFDTTAKKMEMFILNQDESGNQLEEPVEAAEKKKGLKERRRELYKLGHYLKGSSAALGVHEVQDTCEKIQHLGDDKQQDPKKTTISDEDAITEIRDSLFPDVQRQFKVAKAWFIANGYGKDDEA